MPVTKQAGAWRDESEEAVVKERRVSVVMAWIYMVSGTVRCLHGGVIDLRIIFTLSSEIGNRIEVNERMTAMDEQTMIGRA